MSGSADGVPDRDPPGHGAGAEGLARSLGVSLELAESFLGAGYASPESVRGLSDESLEQLGAGPQDIERLRQAPANGGAAVAVANSDQIVEKWMGTVRRSDRSRRRKVTLPPKDSTEVLRKWVDGDDRVMEDWIHSSEPGERAAAAPSAPVPRPVVPPVVEEAPRPPTPDAAGAAVAEREETVVRWLTGLLDRVKSDQFDPTSMIQEAQDLHRQLYDERAKRKQLEDEVEHVKRGSIAVIKYVRAREAKEREVAVREKEDEIAEMKLRLLALESVAGPAAATAPGEPPVVAAPGSVSPKTAADAVEKATREIDTRLREEFSEREHEYIDRESELRRRIVSLEGDVRNLRAEGDRARDREELLQRERGPIAPEVASRLEEVTARERDLVTRENELRTRFEDIRINAEEGERRKSQLEFKERELAAYESQVQTRKQAVELEARRVEEMRREIAQGNSSLGTAEARRLEDTRHEISMRETELKARESLLNERMQELERMGAQAAVAEADRMHEDAARVVEETKVKSGVRRLDDLLYGGFPVAAQVLVNGPAHTGKDVLARLFSVEGLKSGIPSIWVVTDKTYVQVRDDLAGLYPGYAEAEKKGLVRFIDLYSRAIGSVQSNPNVRLLSATDKGMLDQLATTVNSLAEEFKEQYSSYRLIFETVSTLTAYLDIAGTFRFLQPFIGRRKLEKAASYYVLESGMHSESDLETLEHMVDGSVNLKVEQMKTFLAVRGISEVQARAWVGYTFSKRSFNLGSFSLEHIR